jgi:hypothetical protein
LPSLQETIDELRRRRDELALQIHLGSKEAQAEWDELEKKWRKFQADAGIEESGKSIGAALDQLGRELGNAYDRLKKAL